MALTIDPRFVIDLQPSRQAPVTAATYRRRRLVAALALVALVVLLVLASHDLVAGQGGAPASAAVAPAAAVAAPATYIVRPGDTLWGIAEQFAGSRSLVSYVDALVAANGDASVAAGQVIVLP